MSEEQLIFETLGAMMAANALTACVGVIGLGVIGVLAMRPKTRNPGLLFAGLGFSFIAFANFGFAFEGIVTLVVGFQSSEVKAALDLLNRMNCAWSVATIVGLVSLILAFLYSYRRFLPSWREIIIDEGDGPF